MFFELYIHQSEIEADIGDRYNEEELTTYLIKRACMKANKMGADNEKVIDFYWRYDDLAKEYALVFEYEKDFMI